MMKKVKVWMKVTKDKYRLPICIADTSEELAQKLGTNKKNVQSIACKTRKGVCNGTIISVDIEED